MSTAPEQATKPSGDWSQLLRDKVVIVTGAGGGIGSTIAETCVLHGARVAIADVNKKAADEVANKIVNADQTRKDYVLAIELDVVDEKSIKDVVKTIVDKWGTVDVLVNKYVDYRLDCRSMILCFFSFSVLLFLHFAQLKKHQQKTGQTY